MKIKSGKFYRCKNEFFIYNSLSDLEYAELSLLKNYAMRWKLFRKNKNFLVINTELLEERQETLLYILSNEKFHYTNLPNKTLDTFIEEI